MFFPIHWGSHTYVLLLQNENPFSIGEKREYPPYNFTLPIRASTRHGVFMATNKVCKYTMSRKSLLADVFFSITAHKLCKEEYPLSTVVKEKKMQWCLATEKQKIFKNLALGEVGLFSKLSMTF